MGGCLYMRPGEELHVYARVLKLILAPNKPFLRRTDADSARLRSKIPCQI